MITTVGDKVKLKKNNLNGTVKFVGQIKGKYGIWYGIELEKKKGTTDGSVRDINYFKTKKNKGIFVKQYEILKTNTRHNHAPRCSVGDTVRINKFNCNGIIRYIGNTDFKQGIWYGVELKKAMGKNNGTVNNRLYFQCKYKYGIFVKAQSISMKNKNIPNRKQKEPQIITIGDTVQLQRDKLIGTVRFIGNVIGKKGIFYGIALTGNKGKNDGSSNQVKYFKCGKNKGIFVQRNKIKTRINIVGSGIVRVTVGDAVKVKKFDCSGIVRYIGTPNGKKGIWYGVQLQHAKGKNDGTVNDRKYFDCKANFGTFVRADNIIKTEQILLINEVDGDDSKDDIKEIEIAVNNPIDVGSEHGEVKQCDFKAVDVSEYAVDYDHVNFCITDFSDDIQVNGKKYNGQKLLKIFDKIGVKQHDLKMWTGYYGGSIFNGTKDARSRLKTVIVYAEKSSSCSKHIKQKLRVITKLIIKKGVAKSCEYINILLLLASHGNVCNVMKEVAIGNAYGLMTDKLDDFVKQQSLKQQIYKSLRDYRVLLVEVLFHSFGMVNNTHYIASFHNILAKKIGVAAYNDPNISMPTTSQCGNWQRNLDKRYFSTLYTKGNILKHILKQIKENKIGYQKIVKFMQDECPKNVNKMGFLQQAIDIDTGKIYEDYICWMLEKLNVFMIKTDDWKDIVKCWEDIKPLRQ